MKLNEKNIVQINNSYNENRKLKKHNITDKKDTGILICIKQLN